MVELPSPGFPVLPEQVKVDEENLVHARSRLALLPFLEASGIELTGVEERVRMTILIAAAAPPATMCTLLSLRYGKNSIYASEIFAAGTILSIGSLPLVVKATEYLTKIL